MYSSTQEAIACQVLNMSSSTGCVSSQVRTACTQVEYYLSNENLQHDRFFRDLIAEDFGWIDMDPILRCNKIKSLGISREDLLEALRCSELLDVQNGRVRRKAPFRPDDIGHAEGRGGRKGDTKGGKGETKGNPGGGKGRKEMQVPIYDPAGPCGYFMAGYCQHGKKCFLQHSVPYAMAIRDEWLHAGESGPRKALQAAAVEVLGEDAASPLFPRVFSHKLQCKALATAGADDQSLSDLGFEWSTEDATKELAEKKSRWTRHSRRNDQPFENRLHGAPQIHYFLIFDLEGKHEIIEFPVLLFDAVAGREIGRFQKFVRPTDLFKGCQLTETPAVPFPAVLEEFNRWLEGMVGKGLQAMGQDSSDMVFVTCGDWDCKHVWTQCQICGVPAPRAFSQWINIKRTYANTFGGDFRGMKSMQLSKHRAHVATKMHAFFSHITSLLFVHPFSFLSGTVCFLRFGGRCCSYTI